MGRVELGGKKSLQRETGEARAALSSGRSGGAGTATEGPQGTPELLELQSNSTTFKKPEAGRHPQSFSKSKDHRLTSGRSGRTVRR